MQMPRKEAEDGETDVDEKIGTAACDDIDADRRDCKRVGVSLGLVVDFMRTMTYRGW